MLKAAWLPWSGGLAPTPRRVARRVGRLLGSEVGEAFVLLAAAAAALVWINVAPVGYQRFWSTIVAIEVGPFGFDETVRGLVNELLMAVFFYVMALEVKREVLYGSLRELKAATVPVAAAIGSMLGAAAAYLIVNVDSGEPAGWAIPIATDVAFALGALGLVGGSVPSELRAFILTLAVVDDIATIAIIALVYTSHLAVDWLVIAVAAVVIVVALERAGVRQALPYGLLAGLLWFALLEAGVHATIAGVVLGFLTPAAALDAPRRAASSARSQLSLSLRSDEVDEHELLAASSRTREAVSPLVRIEERLRPWTMYSILPVFALANAGVRVSLGGIRDAFSGPVGLGIVFGLVVGAPLLGTLAAWAVVRVGPARLPDALDWKAVGAVAPLKGIGFTVAIFIAVLAFDDPALQDQAKLAILVASMLAALIGITALYLRHRLRGS